jgi:uncharacterized protein
VKIAVLADTHIPKRAKGLPARAWEVIEAADVVIHAGDVLTRQFLDELEQRKPLHVVRGNNDVTLQDLPEVKQIEVEGIKIAVIHDSGDKKNRAQRMRKKFPQADIVVFGHSHIPINEVHDGLRLFNPGSATDRRRQPVCTMGLLTIVNGNVQAELIELP